MATEDRAAPRTEAGRLFAREFREWLVYEGWEREGWDLDATAREFTKSILAVEREAAAAPALDPRVITSAIGATFGDYAGDDIPWPPTQEFADRVIDRLSRLTPPGDRDRREAEQLRKIGEFLIAWLKDWGTSEEQLEPWRLALASPEAAGPPVETTAPPPVAAVAEDPAPHPNWTNADFVQNMPGDRDRREAPLVAALVRVRRLANERHGDTTTLITDTVNRALLAAPGEAAAPGAAALDRLREEVERLRDKSLRLQNNTTRAAKVRHEGATQMAAAVLAIVERLGARAAEPKPPESAT